MPFLTPQQRAAYDHDGFLVIDGFLDPATVATVQADIAALCDRNRALTSDHAGLNLEKVGDASLDRQAAAKRPGMLRKVQGAVFQLASVRDVFCRGRLVALMEELMGGPTWYHSSKVMFKAANGGAPKPWHQDAAYWTEYAAEQITVWIAIHDADQANGCVWAIPGSHKEGLIPHSELELQVAAARLDLSRAVPVPVRAGGLLIFHSLVLHKSDRNTSDRDRWAIICDYDCVANPAIDVNRDASVAIPELPGYAPDARQVWKLHVDAAAGGTPLAPAPIRGRQGHASTSA